MGYDIVEHLAAVDVLKDHVVVMLMHDQLAHPANIRMVQEQTERRLANCADLLGCVFAMLLCILARRRHRVLRPWHDFDSKLPKLSETTPTTLTTERRTFSPVPLCWASLTLPMLPCPRVFPNV